MFVRLCSIFVIVLTLGVAAFPAFADKSLEKVRMQLRWHHQYQFAGYYAAKHKGFYQQAGFDVEIIAGGPDRQPVTELLAGRADFAEGNGEVLIARLRGEPIVALAALFQHSPSVLLTLAKSDIQTPTQLRGKKVMLMGGENDADLIAMFHAEGVNLDEIDTINSSYNIDDLIDGKVIAFNSYLTNEPYYVEQKGLAYNVLNPKDYGVDFYSDILFTTEEQVRSNPERVERFKQATLKGWNYAINHSEEIIHLIYDKYNKNKSLHHMRFEALAVNSLVKSELLPIGHIFEKRIDRMADVFINQKMVKDKSHLDNFIYIPREEVSSRLLNLLYLSTFIIVVCFVVLSAFIKINRELKLQIAQKKQAEAKLKVLADNDGLTGLLNRRAFIECYKTYEAMAKRYNQAFTLVLFDLDFFKSINDEFGHDVGDRVLVLVADVIKRTIREADIGGRFGGEEFTLLLAHTEISQSLVIIERLRKELENIELKVSKNQRVRITASFGLVQWHGERMEEMLKKVDLAMYEAKSSGRNQLKVFHNAQ